MDIVITGANGFIGSELVRYFLTNYDSGSIYALIRPSKDLSAEEKFQKIKSYWAKFFDISKYDFNRVKIISFDYSNDKPYEISGSIKIFFNCVANTGLNISLTEGRSANLFTVQKIVSLAKKHKSLDRFVHFSTAYVSGKTKGLITEDIQSNKFFNNYEKSKSEGEAYVRDSGLPWTILRPSIVVGRSDNGYVKGFRVVYAVFRMWFTGFMKRAPLGKKSKTDIVPVDYVVKAADILSTHPDSIEEIYHVCAGKDQPYSHEIFACGLKVFNMPPPKLTPIWFIYILINPLTRPFIGHGLRHIIDSMLCYLPHLISKDKVYSTIKLKKIMEEHGISCPLFSSYGKDMFEFCKKSKWGKLALR